MTNDQSDTGAKLDLGQKRMTALILRVLAGEMEAGTVAATQRHVAWTDASLSVPHMLLRLLGGALGLFGDPAHGSNPAFAMRAALETPLTRGLKEASWAWMLVDFAAEGQNARLRLELKSQTAEVLPLRVAAATHEAIVAAASRSRDLDFANDDAALLLVGTLPENGEVVVTLPEGWTWAARQPVRVEQPSASDGGLWVVLAAEVARGSVG